jgi:hypothetical protein
MDMGKFSVWRYFSSSFDARFKTGGLIDGTQPGISCHLGTFKGSLSQARPTSRPMLPLLVVEAS